MTLLVDVVQDGGESAETLHRPGIQRVLKLVHERHVRAVIVAKLDRLTRSVKDLCELLELFERRGVVRISVAQSLDTGSASGRLVINIMGGGLAVGAGGDTRADARRPAAQTKPGERTGNIAFGYRLAAAGKHVEPDAPEQAVLGEIQRLSSGGRCAGLLRR